MSASSREAYDNAWHAMAELDRELTMQDWADECIDAGEYEAYVEQEVLNELIAEVAQTKEQGRL